LNKIDKINTWNDFDSKYEHLSNAIRSKMLGKDEDSDLKNKLNDLKARITDVDFKQNNIMNKFNNLYEMANGRMRYIFDAAAKNK